MEEHLVEALTRAHAQVPTSKARPVAAMAPPIADHRVLSDGRSAALLRPDGEVDWWCAPAFDSPPLAWSLLDPGGGLCRWRLQRPVDAHPAPAGPVATTTLDVGSGRVTCRDGLVGVDDGAVALVRLVRSVEGRVQVTHELRLGGFNAAWATWSDTSASVDGATIALLGDAAPVVHGPWVRHDLVAEPGAWTGLAVVVGGRGDTSLGQLVTRLDEAERRFSAALAGARLPRSHPDRACDALAVLRSCTYGPTGAIVASPATSLPEAPGGDRQWDYRYCWLRDAGLAASVAALLGDRDAADGYLAFVRGLAGDAAPRAPLVTIRGGPVPPEQEVEGVAGWGGARPVRVGNGAATQLQYDALGLVVEAVSVFLQTGGRLDEETWRLVRTIADEVAAEPARPSSGIWELRDERNLTSGDIGRWLALDRAIWIGRGWRPRARRRHWKRARAQVRDRVLGALRSDGRLPQAYGEDPPRADAAALMVPMFGMLSRRDRRAHALVDAVLADLDAAPFLYRYEPDGHDGFSPGEGAFLPVTWWAVSALASLGRVDEARARLDQLCARLPRLLAEEVDPMTGAALGNIPLVWSHMELARALYVVDAAERRARWGPVGLWAWRLNRYAKLRWSRR